MKLENKKIGKTVYLDYDIKFESIQDGSAAIVPGIVARLATMEEIIGARIEWVLIRPSGRGNTHMAIVLSQEIDILTLYCIRAALKEDIYRLMLDMARYYTTGDPDQINLIWDSKVVDGVKYEAGPWESWDWRQF